MRAVQATSVATWVAFSACSVTWSADENRSLQLQCRVVDTAGNPVEGATVRLRQIDKQPASPQEAVLAKLTGFFRTKAKVKSLSPTNSKGLAESDGLVPGKTYVLDFRLNGFLPAVSHRNHALDSGAIQLPDVTMRRVRTIHGKVTDRAGAAIAGVTVFQSGNGSKRKEATTGDDGLFQLDGVPEGTSLVFASHDDYWFRGLEAPPGNKPCSIVLAARNAPNPEQYDLDAASPDEISIENVDGDAGVEKLVERFRNAAQKGEQLELIHSFSELAMHDADRADILLDEVKIADVLRNRFRMQLVGVMARSDFDVAKAMLQPIEDPAWRMTALYSLLAAVGDNDQPGLMELLSIALADLRAMNNPYERIDGVRMLYPFLIKAGEKATAQKLVDDTVRELRKSGVTANEKRIFGTLAEAVAPYDPDLALSLLEDSDPMYAAWVAYAVAPYRPERAAELIRGYKFSTSGGSRLRRWYSLPRVCYRMAPANLPLAKGLADLSDGAVEEFKRYVPPDADGKTSAEGNVAPALLNAQLYGFMARAIADKDSRRARSLLTEAVAMLMPLREGVRHEIGFIYTPSIVLASLVGTAAKVDRGLAAEICWQAMSMRDSTVGEETDDALVIDSVDAHLIQALAPLEADLASHLLGRLADRAVARCADGRHQDIWNLVTAFHTVDPARGAQWIESLCDRPPAKNELSPRQRAKQFWLRHSGMISGSSPSGRPSIAQQAEKGILNTLWMNGVIQDE